MSTDDRDDLVGDVADALTLGQQVPWERCARLAAGAEREQIENLRVVECVLASRPVAGPAAETGWWTSPMTMAGPAAVGESGHAGRRDRRPTRTPIRANQIRDVLMRNCPARNTATPGAT